MINVKIICGAYGHKDEGASATRLIEKGDVVAVTEAEAKRLVDMGVAEYCEAAAKSGEAVSRCQKAAEEEKAKPAAAVTAAGKVSKPKTDKAPKMTAEKPV